MNYTIIENGHTYVISTATIVAILALAIWTIVWKGLALWRAAELGQKKWFVAILLLNTLGILEIAYLFIFSKKPDNKDN